MSELHKHPLLYVAIAAVMHFTGAIDLTNWPFFSDLLAEAADVAREAAEAGVASL